MILSGWKDIAKHLGCAVRTVQRWQRVGLPVRRPTPGPRASVVAFSEEIDAWLKSDPRADFHVAPAPISDRSQPFPHRILLVDDDESFLISLGETLSREGYDVRTARDGFEALAMLGGGLPDLIISDLRMPNMSGFELLSVMRRRYPSVAVIAQSREFTPAADPVLLCDKYIEKGQNFKSELLDSIRDALSRSSLRNQPPKAVAAAVWLRAIEHIGSTGNARTLRHRLSGQKSVPRTRSSAG